MGIEFRLVFGHPQAPTFNPHTVGCFRDEGCKFKVSLPWLGALMGFKVMVFITLRCDFGMTNGKLGFVG